MKKHHFGLLFLACLFMTCAELQRMEVRNPSRSKPKTSTPPKTPTPTKAGKLPVFPVTGQSSRNIISYFGDERAGGARRHEGIDIGAPRGTTVLSVCNGEVTRVVEKGNGGKQVWVLSSDGTRTFYYAHLDKQLVEEGQDIKVGDILGTVGNTGNAAGGPTHLHFEVIDQNGKSMDPLPFMPI
jgi:murein DD-endopeptidase MepM/ murein hydrolase activator NlpD